MSLEPCTKPSCTAVSMHPCSTGTHESERSARPGPTRYVAMCLKFGVCRPRGAAAASGGPQTGPGRQRVTPVVGTPVDPQRSASRTQQLTDHIRACARADCCGTGSPAARRDTEAPERRSGACLLFPALRSAPDGLLDPLNACLSSLKARGSEEPISRAPAATKRTKSVANLLKCRIGIG